MNIIEVSIRRPTAVMAGVLMIVALGLLALVTIPIQLTPDVNRPVLQISTSWSSASPVEVERDITNRIEQELTGLEGLQSMTSNSQSGRSRIYLEFSIGQNMDRAFMLVSNKLNGISDLPDESRKPEIRTSGSDDEPIARLAITHLPGNSRDIGTYGDLVEDVVVDRLERVEGVSQVDFSGGTRQELQIIVEPTRLADFGQTVPRLLQALRAANFSVTAGAVDEGKRRYVVRVDSDTATIEKVQSIVLYTADKSVDSLMTSVTVGDIATVQFGYKEPSTRRRFNGKPMIRLNVIREAGANVIETMDGVREAVAELNDVSLQNEQLELVLFYDETIYINSAIDLVQQNIYVGGTFAVIILLLFLRNFRAILVVSMSIPVSVIGTFVAMAMVGRSINVISLAGIAFAVGMVVDAAIVVLENIYRYRQMGRSARQASEEGTQQVWGAILASALTTVLVFVPLLILKLEVGQLFRDIAVAISVSVMLTLIVSITVIPSLSQFLLQKGVVDPDKRFRIPVIDPFAEKFVSVILGIVGRTINNKIYSLSAVAVICGGAILVTTLFLPKLDYLPDGNLNFVFGRISPPPGYNLNATYQVTNAIEEAVKPLWSSLHGPESKEGEPPKIGNFFFIAGRSFAFFGGDTIDPNRADELIPIFRKPIFAEPGSRGFISQRSIFSRNVGGSRSININVSHTDMDTILNIARKADRMIAQVLPRNQGTQVSPRPGLELAAPEVRLTPDLNKLARSGMTARDFGQTIDVLNEGIKVNEVTIGSKRMDMTLKSPNLSTTSTQGIGFLPVTTPSGEIVTAESLSTIDITSGPIYIRHNERVRTITLQIRPTRQLPLETAIEILKRDVVDKLYEEGLPTGVKITMTGAADNLSKTWSAMKINLLVAITIVFLVLAVLFESFTLPLIIMLSVPSAAAGGVIGLALLNQFVTQNLDMLTMLGFVILIGIVVNNAILLVDQTRHQLKEEGVSPTEAIMIATRNRMRPIFMSTLTSVFGLLPLVLFPGAGSELYRGLGSVVVGGLSLSALLTVMLIPPLLALTLSSSKKTEPVSGPMVNSDKSTAPAE